MSNCLETAISYGRKDIVTLLLDHGADPNKLIWDRPLLWIATSEGRGGIAKILLDRGAKADQVEKWNSTTPFLIAIKKGHLPIAQILLKHGAIIYAADQYGHDALYYALDSGRTDIIQFLLKHLIQESKSNPQHAFSTTSVFRLAGDQFIYEGDVHILNQQGMDDIGRGNYIYCPYWSSIQTRLSHGIYVENAAIILGTTDKEKCSKLHFASKGNP